MNSRVDAFCSYLADNKPLLWPAVERNKKRNERAFGELGGTLLAWAENSLRGDYLKTLTDGYASFVLDVNKSQMRYERQKRYQHSTFAEACANVYHNDDYGSPYDGQSCAFKIKLPIKPASIIRVWVPQTFSEPPEVDVNLYS